MEKYAFVYVITLGIFLTAAAETGNETSSIHNVENESTDITATTILTTADVELGQGQEKIQTVNEDETDINDYIVTSSTTKRPNKTRNKKRNKGNKGKKLQANPVKTEPSTTESPRTTDDILFEEKDDNFTLKPRRKDLIVEYVRNDSAESDFPSISKEVSSQEHDLGDDEEKNSTICTSPPEIEGAITPVLKGNEHALGTLVNYNCNYGYVNRNSVGQISVCKRNERTGKAEWTIPEIACIPRSCGDPGYVPNAHRIGNLFTFPNKIEFKCERGYKLRGVGARFCQAGGEWSGRLPICEQIYCSVPPHPPNGRVRYSSLEYGTELRYQCDHGFILKNHETRFCTEDGSWSNNEPKCIEARCEIPNAPDRGLVRLSEDPKVGSLALYSCQDGTTLIGSSTSKCLISGEWTFPPPKCFTSCYVPAIKDGEMGKFSTRYAGYGSQEEFLRLSEGERVQHTQSVYLRCKDGFMPVEYSATSKNTRLEQVTCSDGIWSKLLECKSTSCLGEPPETANAKTMISSRAHGKSVWYQCDKGYLKEKTGDIKCDFGTWVGYTPVCSDGRCHINKLNYTGLQRPQQPQLNSGDSFTIVCENGYRKKSRKKKISCFKGNWDIDQNPCIGESCGDKPPAIENGNPVETSREHGAIVEYKCDKNYEINENSAIQCRHGQWVGRLPICMSKLRQMVTTVEGHPMITTSSISGDVSSGSSALPNECSCSYKNGNILVDASIGDRKLEWGDYVAHGETITLKCPYKNMVLVWPSGLHLHGPVNFPCSRCQVWQTKDLPDCKVSQHSDTVIMYNEKLKILPGGFLEIKKRENIRLECRTRSWYPIRWNAGGKQVLYFDSFEYVSSTRWNITYMDIFDASEEHSGRYECFTEDYYGQIFRSSFLDLRVTALSLDEIRCKELIDSNGIFDIVYDNDRRVNSYAYYTCKDRNKEIAGTTTRRCLDSGLWSGSVPICQALSPDEIRCKELIDSNGIFDIVYNNDRRVNSYAYYTCKDRNKEIAGTSTRRCLDSGLWSGSVPICQAPLHNAVRCYELINSRGIFNIVYDDDRKVNSQAHYTCKDSTQKIIGLSVRTCLDNGRWSGSAPTCEDITCNTFPIDNELSISYTKSNKVNSIATFSCPVHAQLIGSWTSICQRDGLWSNPQPICQVSDIQCPQIDGIGIFSLFYDNDRRINSTAQFFCLEDGKKVHGCKFVTCLPDGNWSGVYPTCVDYVICVEFPSSPGLEVKYSNDVRVGSIASFYCSPPTTLVGNSESTCIYDGTWSYPMPRCEDPKCAIYDLSSSVPIGIIPDVRDVTGEFVALGSEVRLDCENNLILNGNSKAKCVNNGKWEYGSLQCVSGCLLKKDESSHLIVRPMREKYRFGEFIVLTCPPGQKLTSEEEKLMCLGKTWSHPIPDCIELDDSSVSEK